MALSKNSFNNSGPLIFLSPRSKDKDGNEVPPHFTVGRSVDGKITDDEETVTSVSGDLIRLELKEREYKGDVSKEAVLYLRDSDANETYRLPIYFGIPGRSLFNSLASLTEAGDFTGLSIDYYRNKKGFDAFAMKQGGEQVSWKYGLDELPKPEEIMHKGKLLKRDYGEVNEFFEEELKAIIAKIGGNKSAAARPTNTAAAAPAAATNDTKQEDVPAAATPTPSATDKPAAESKPAATKTTGKRASKATAAAVKETSPEVGGDKGDEDVPF